MADIILRYDVGRQLLTAGSGVELSPAQFPVMYFGAVPTVRVTFKNADGTPHVLPQGAGVVWNADADVDADASTAPMMRTVNADFTVNAAQGVIEFPLSSLTQETVDRLSKRWAVNMMIVVRAYQLETVAGDEQAVTKFAARFPMRLLSVLNPSNIEVNPPDLTGDLIAFLEGAFVPLSFEPLNAVATDESLTGDGTAGNPLSVVPGAESVVITDSTLTGDGTVEDPLSVADDIVNGAAAGATAVQGTPWTAEGYLTEIPQEVIDGAALGMTALQEESDTLADVVGRNPDADQAAITNAASYEAMGEHESNIVAAGFTAAGANQVYVVVGEQAGRPLYNGVTDPLWAIGWTDFFGDGWYIEFDGGTPEIYSFGTSEQPTGLAWTDSDANPVPGSLIALPVSSTLAPDGVKDSDNEHVYAFRYKTLQHAVGNVSGAVALDALNGTVQTLVVTDDITDISINNLAGNVVMLHIDNTAGKSILIPSIDYIAGEIPEGPGTFAVYVYAVNGLIFAAISEHFEAV